MSCTRSIYIRVSRPFSNDTEWLLPSPSVSLRVIAKRGQAGDDDQHDGDRRGDHASARAWVAPVSGSAGGAGIGTAGVRPGSSGVPS
jgi:hypothetical protein